MLPTLPAYIQDVGGTIQQVGIVMGCFAIGLLLSRTWLGQLADRRSRKLVMSIGAIVAAIAPLGYVLVQSIPALMAIRAFHGISIAAFTTGYSALVVDLSPLKQRGELMGYMSLAVPIGMAVGPALGGILLASGGYGDLFVTSASFGCFALILTSQVRENRKIPAIEEISDNPDASDRSFWEVLSRPSLIVPTSILLLVGLLFGTLVSFFPLFLREEMKFAPLLIQIKIASLSLESVKLDFAGVFYTAAAIASFTVRFISGQASDRYGRGLFITMSLVCYGASMALLTVAQTPNIFILAAILEGAGGGILIPILFTLISERCHPDERGRVFAVCGGGFDVGIAIAGPVLGSLQKILGYRGLFSLAANLALLALFLFMTKSNKTFSHSLRFAVGRGKDLYALH